MSEEAVRPMGQVIQIDEGSDPGPSWRDGSRWTVEETLNAMLDAEADQLMRCSDVTSGAKARAGYQGGSYERQLQTKAGEVGLKVPKLRRQTFETAIIERYRRRESSVEEALIEMYLAGVSVGAWRTSRKRCGARGCQPEHGVEPEQEDLREDRGLAEPAHRR